MRDLAEYGSFRHLAVIGAAILVLFIVVRVAGGNSAMTSTFAIAFPLAMVLCALALRYVKRTGGDAP